MAEVRLIDLQKQMGESPQHPTMEDWNLP
jgi:hypothetical protein